MVGTEVVDTIPRLGSTASENSDSPPAIEDTISNNLLVDESRLYDGSMLHNEFSIDTTKNLKKLRESKLN